MIKLECLCEEDKKIFLCAVEYYKWFLFGSTNNTLKNDFQSLLENNNITFITSNEEEYQECFDKGYIIKTKSVLGLNNIDKKYVRANTIKIISEVISKIIYKDRYFDGYSQSFNEVMNYFRLTMYEPNIFLRVVNPNMYLRRPFIYDNSSGNSEDVNNIIIKLLIAASSNVPSYSYDTFVNERFSSPINKSRLLKDRSRVYANDYLYYANTNLEMFIKSFDNYAGYDSFKYIRDMMNNNNWDKDSITSVIKVIDSYFYGRMDYFKNMNLIHMSVIESMINSYETIKLDLLNFNKKLILVN